MLSFCLSTPTPCSSPTFLSQCLFSPSCRHRAVALVLLVLLAYYITLLFVLLVFVVRLQPVYLAHLRRSHSLLPTRCHRRVRQGPTSWTLRCVATLPAAYLRNTLSFMATFNSFYERLGIASTLSPAPPCPRPERIACRPSAARR